MKLKVSIAALVLSLAGYAGAATINAQALTDLDFTTDNSDYAFAIDSTFTVNVGIYSGGALDNSADAATIGAAWQNAGSFAAATNTGGYNGFINTGDLAFVDGDGFVGNNVWVWITGNGGDSNILLQALDSGAGDFQFKADADTPNSGVVAFFDGNQASWDIALGSFDAGGANATYGGSYILNTVPEPATALLGAFGVIGLLRRRRA